MTTDASAIAAQQTDELWDLMHQVDSTGTDRMSEALRAAYWLGIAHHVSKSNDAKEYSEKYLNDWKNWDD